MSKLKDWLRSLLRDWLGISELEMGLETVELELDEVVEKLDATRELSMDEPCGIRVIDA